MATSRKFHVSPYKPVSVRPAAGGKLMSNVSADSAGIYNYQVKRDFRRFLDREIRAEGYDFFQPNTAIPLGDQPFPGLSFELPTQIPGSPQPPPPPPPPSTLPITLQTQVRQPNGRTAIVCGTPTTLYRYFALDDGAYYTGNGTPNAYYAETGPSTPYYDDNPGVWIVIGTNFSPIAQRWEAVELNGYLILNNGVDLPVTYRAQDFQVQPIYELREAGIASVGNISVSNDLLLCADISEINDGSSDQSILSSGTVTASLASGTVTASQSFFTPASVGKLIQFLDGTTTTITGYTSGKIVTVSDNSDSISNQLFSILPPFQSSALTNILSTISSNGVTASQAGNIGPTSFGATLIGGTVVSSSPAFSPSSVGQTIVWVNGISATINAYLSPTSVTVNDLTDTINPGLSFWLNNPGTTDFTVISSAPIFTASNVGQMIIWDNGNIRVIRSFIDSQHVTVDSNVPAVSGTFSFSNPAAYSAFTDQSQTNRIQYRIINGIPGEPRRWASSAPGSINKGSRILKLQYPMVSLQELVGQQITVLGAGVDGGNLTATLLSLDLASLNAVLDTPAATTVTNALVQAFDATGSLVSFTDLQDDGSGIIGMLDLLGYLIVYKDTSIFIGQFSGQVGNVFNFNGQTEYHGSKTLYYRNTLIKVNAGGTEFHLFAGRNSFYRFDMITQEPNEVQTGELCKDIFFNNASIPAATGANLVTPGTVYGTPITVPVIAGCSYYFTKGANESLLQNGTTQLNASGEFVAQGFSVTLSGVIGQPSTGAIQLVNNIGVFAADNSVTKEVFFCFPLGNGPDYALRYDYFTGQISSTSGRFTAAASIKRPVAGIQIGPSEDWFIMGLISGTVVRYGLTNTLPTPSGAISATQSINTVTASAPIFSPDLVTGRSLQWADKSVANVTNYISPTQITVGGPPLTRAASSFLIISAVWHRLGQPYPSVIQSGLESFGMTFGEKDLEAIVVILSSDSPNSQLLLEVLGAINPTNTPIVLGSQTFTNPLIQNAVGMLFRQNWFGDRITVNGMNNPMELVERIYNIAGVNSKAFIQR